MQMAPVELVGLASESVRTAGAVAPSGPCGSRRPAPVEVTGDKDRLRQVLDNLLANVRAHTPPGTTATVHVDQIGDQAQIEVRDTGPGMPEEDAHPSLRAVFPCRPRPGAHPRGQRVGAVHRLRHRDRPRRDRHGHLGTGGGVGGHRPHPGQQPAPGSHRVDPVAPIAEVAPPPQLPA